MVAGAGGYYREPFYGERGMPQGEPVSPTIFNVVVDAVARHWEYLATEGDGRDGRDNSSGKKWPRQRDK